MTDLVEGTEVGARVSTRSLLGYTVAKVVPGLLNVAAIPIIIGVIGAGQYALFSTTWALCLIASVIGVGWLRNSALRAAGELTSAMGMLPRWSLLASVCLPAVLVVGWLTAVGSAMPSLRTPTIMVCAAAFCLADAGYTLLATRAQRDLRPGRFAVGESVRAAAGLGAALAFCELVPVSGAAAVLAGYCVGALAGALILYGPVPPRLHREPHPLAGAVLASYWRYGWPMSLWFAASVGLMYVDRLLLTVLLDAETAGRYAAVADLVVRGMTMLALPIGMAAHPVLMIHWNRGERRLAMATLFAYARVLAVVLACGVAGLACLGPWVIGILVPAGSNSRGLIVLLALGGALWQCGLLAQKTLEMSGHSRVMMTLMGLSALVTIALDLLLVPALGPPGSALALLAGAAGYTAGCLTWSRRRVAMR